MVRVGLCTIVLFLLAGFSLLSGTVQSNGEKESQEMRLLAESTLSNARKDSNFGTAFKDTDVRRAFSRDQNVVAVLLRITSRGNEIREVGVYVSYNDNSKVFLMKTIPAGHADIMLIKKVLKL
jgi:hypothetical protein